MNEETKELILQKAKEGKVVFATFEGLMSADLNDFIKQPADGILYDLNRLPEVVMTFINDPKWVNDFAVQLVIKKLFANWKAAEHRVQLTAFGVGGLALLAGLVIGWLSCLAFIGGN